jgi:Restriction endonuclease S subunits
MNENLPIGWVRCHLGTVISVKNGYAFKSSDYSTEGVPLIRISDIQEGKVILKNSVFIPKEKANLDFTVQNGDLLIAMSGATTGKVGIYTGKEICLQNQRVGNFKILYPQLLNTRFRDFFVLSIRKQIEDAGYGGAQPNISSSVLESFEIPLPPINEQRRIVEKLDRIFDRLRRVRDELSHIKKLIDRYKQSVLTAAFRGDLTADWREENQKEIFWNKEILRKEISKRQEAEIPESWLTISLGDIVDYGKTIKVEPNDIPMDAWILELEDIEKDSSRLLQRVTFEKRLSKSTKNRFFKGDVLYGKLRPYLNKVLIADKDGYCTTEIIPIRPNELIGAHYLFYWFKHPRFLEYVDSVSHGIQMPRLGTNAGLKAPLVLAPIEEQKEIVRRIEERFAKIDKLEQEYQKAVKLCDRLEQETLAKAFRGELVPQDPNDEPASVLLERIRSEKKTLTQPKGKSRRQK